MACLGGRGRAGFDGGSSSASEQQREVGGSEQTSHCKSGFEPVSKGGQSPLAETCVHTLASCGRSGKEHGLGSQWDWNRYQVLDAG